MSKYYKQKAIPLLIIVLILLLLFSILFVASFQKNSIVIGIILFIFIIFIAKLLDKYSDQLINFYVGEKGEKYVIKSLNNIDGLYLYNDIVLPGEKWNIDHVVVSRKGVFVIETKYYSTEVTVYGDDWYTRRKGYHGKKIKLKSSPSKQAKANALKLRAYLLNQMPKEIGLKFKYIKPLVVLVKGYNKDLINYNNDIIPLDMLKERVYAEKVEYDKEILNAVKRTLDILISLDK